MKTNDIEHEQCLNEFEILFKKFYSPLCNFVNNNINDWGASEDIVQSAFVNYWKNNKIKDIQSTKPYLYKAVKNGMIDHFKYTNKSKDVERAIQSQQTTSMDKEINSLVIKNEIYKSINKLKPKMKKIFLLNRIEGLTYPEISEFLGISSRTVEDNMARAFKLLREDLKNNEELRL